MTAYVRGDDGEYTQVRVTKVSVHEHHSALPCWCPECQRQDRLLIASRISPPKPEAPRP